MLLKPGQKIEGFSAAKMRDALRRVCLWREVGFAFKAEFGERADEALQVCVASGYLLEKRDSNSSGVTKLGGQLANARVGRPVPREVADQRLREVLQRARALNRDGAVPRVVTKLAVFGEYLDESRTKIDRLDFILETAERPGVPPFDPWGVARAFSAAKKLSAPRDIGKALVLPREFVFRTLRGRATDVAFADLDVAERLNVELRIVLRYERTELVPWSLTCERKRQVGIGTAG